MRAIHFVIVGVSFIALMHDRASAAARPANIVILVADDLGYGETGMQANPRNEIPTPHIDAIARNGFRFTQCYVTAPFCAPSRAGYITGIYQTRFGSELNPTGERLEDERAGIPQSVKTFAEYFKPAGYATGMVGKWHLGEAPHQHPLARGFDTFYGFMREGRYFLPEDYAGEHSNHFRDPEPPYNVDNPVLRGRTPIEEPQYLTEAITRESLAFIETHADKPFLLYVPYNAVHSPMQATAKYMKRFPEIGDYHRQVFAAMLAAMDDSIGAITAKLREKGLEENTLVIFFSDHGGPTAELTSRNDPLRGGKGQMFEGGLRVPFAMQWKGTLPANKVYEHPVSTLDLLPTALAAARIAIPRDLEGVNLLPYLRGQRQEPPHEALFWRMGNQKAAALVGDWKMVVDRGEPMLFNIARDPSEQHDLASQQPQKLAELQAAWDKWNQKNIEPRWTQPPRPRPGPRNSGKK